MKIDEVQGQLPDLLGDGNVQEVDGQIDFDSVSAVAGERQIDALIRDWPVKLCSVTAGTVIQKKLAYSCTHIHTRMHGNILTILPPTCMHIQLTTHPTASTRVCVRVRVCMLLLPFNEGAKRRPGLETLCIELLPENRVEIVIRESHISRANSP